MQTGAGPNTFDGLLPLFHRREITALRGARMSVARQQIGAISVGLVLTSVASENLPIAR
jgi:hypothetical protein